MIIFLQLYVIKTYFRIRVNKNFLMYECRLYRCLEKDIV